MPRSEEAVAAADSPFPAMVEEGVFFGVFDGEEIVAAAWTYFSRLGSAPKQRGNVHTRRAESLFSLMNRYIDRVG